MGTVYKFQCNRCFIIGGHMSRNQNDAPACCGGEPMTAIAVSLPITQITTNDDESPENKHGT